MNEYDIDESEKKDRIIFIVLFCCFIMFLIVIFICVGRGQILSVHDDVKEHIKFITSNVLNHENIIEKIKDIIEKIGLNSESTIRFPRI